MENSITVGEELRKYFYESGLNFLSSVPQRRIQEMILAMAQKGHSGKMTDCGELGAGHRTTYGHFLSKGKWDHEKVETVQRQKSFQTILSVAEKASLRRCCPEHGTKVDMTVEVIDSIQESEILIRSAKAIDRFLIILTLAWFWFTQKTGFVLPFSVGIRRYRGLLSIL